MIPPLLCRRWMALGLLGLLGIVPAVGATSAARFRQIKVELAWMSDPVTFRCPLRAQVTNSQIRIVGMTPSEAVRTRALHLARQTLNGPVADGVTIGPVGALAHLPTPVAEVTSSVKKVLTEMLGDSTGKSVEVAVDNEGRVLLYASSASLEHKHALGVRLRSVRGCSCVVYATSREMMQQSVPLTPTPPVADSGAAKSAPRSLPAPVTEPARPLKKGRLQPTPRVSSASPYNFRRVLAQLPEEKVIANTGKKPTPPPVARTVTTYAPARPATPPPGFNPVAEPLTPTPRLSKEAAVPLTSEPLASKPLPSGPPTLAPKSPATGVPATPATPPKPTRSLFSFFRKTSTPANASPTKPVPAPGPTLAKPYVTTGTVIFHDAPPPATAPAPAPTPITSTVSSAVAPEVLRRKVLGAGGSLIRDVQVKPHATKGLQVTIKVDQNAQLEPLMNRIFQVPELTAPDIHIAFEIAP